MTPFYTRFGELAARETRCIHQILPGGPLSEGTRIIYHRVGQAAGQDSSDRKIRDFCPLGLGQPSKERLGRRPLETPLKLHVCNS
jgi:hypothetical protein